MPNLFDAFLAECVADSLGWITPADEPPCTYPEPLEDECHMPPGWCGIHARP